jgi:hypothetical protein
MDTGSDTRRIAMIAGGVILGLIALCGLCGMVLFAASFLLSGT